MTRFVFKKKKKRSQERNPRLPGYMDYGYFGFLFYSFLYFSAVLFFSTFIQLYIFMMKRIERIFMRRVLVSMFHCLCRWPVTQYLFSGWLHESYISDYLKSIQYTVARSKVEMALIPSENLYYVTVLFSYYFKRVSLRVYCVYTYINKSVCVCIRARVYKTHTHTNLNACAVVIKYFAKLNRKIDFIH